MVVQELHQCLLREYVAQSSTHLVERQGSRHSESRQRPEGHARRLLAGRREPLSRRRLSAPPAAQSSSAAMPRARAGSAARMQASRSRLGTGSRFTLRHYLQCHSKTCRLAQGAYQSLRCREGGVSRCWIDQLREGCYVIPPKQSVLCGLHTLHLHPTLQSVRHLNAAIYSRATII